MTRFLQVMDHSCSRLAPSAHSWPENRLALRAYYQLTNRQEVTETQVAKIDERTQRLTSAHGQDVQEIVNLIAAAIVKQSPTITTQLAHSMVYGRLKKRFRARSYIEIPDERFDEVMSYLRGELRTWGQRIER